MAGKWSGEGGMGIGDEDIENMEEKRGTKNLVSLPTFNKTASEKKTLDRSGRLS